MINNETPKNKNYPAILEILPLFLFFALNKYYDIFVATGALIFTSIINFAIAYWYTKTIHPIPLITVVLAVIFGGLTIIFHNDSFIKLKVTIINVCFAGILIAGYLFKTNFLKIVFKSNLNLEEKGWKILNNYWITFFITLAIINEIIWRNFSTEAWVNFKVFGIIVLSFIFLILQFPIIKKYSKTKLF
jgi:intracellular septation protein